MWQLVAAAVFVFSGWVRADLPSTSQPFKSTFTGTANDYEYRIPAMAVSTSGTVIVSADGRFSNADVPGRIDNVIRRSTDNGNTWGPKIVTANYGTDTTDTDIYPIFSTTVAQSRTSASDPALLVDRTNGRIWVFYDNGSTASYNGYGRTIKLEMRYSDDDGLTWSARYDVESVNPNLRPKPTETYTFNGSTYTYGKGEYIVGPGNGIQIERGIHAGRLIFPVYWYRTNNCSSFIYSDDRGATWQRGGICGYGTGEVQITELTDGSLLASMRPSGAGSGYRWFSKSTDGGVTWSALFRFNNTAPYPVADPTCQGSIFRLSTTEDSNTNRLVHANCDSTSSRVKMTVRTSYDEGTTWPVSRLVYTSTAGYSALARLATGDIGLLYEKDGFAAIDFVRITIPEATNNTDDQPAYNLWANTIFTYAQLMNPAISGRDADADGDGISNYQEFLLRPFARIAVTDASAFEVGANTTLQFTVTLSTNATSATAVNLSYSGTATAGTDYSAPPAQIVIPAGQTQATVTLTALDDAVADGLETVIVTVIEGAASTPGAPDSASGTIDDLSLPGVTVAATDAAAAETGDPGVFTITRNDIAEAAVIYYTAGGTATEDGDYVALDGSISFSAGQETATVVVSPLDDPLYERASETVVVTLTAGAGYTVGAPASATVTISSDEAHPRKANNTDALNLASSWLGDAPLSTETVWWDNIVTSANTASLGAATTWAGITDGCTNGWVTISGAYTLAAGAITVDSGASLVLGNGGSTLSLTSLTGAGTLVINKTGNQDMSSSLNSANAFNFTGTLQFRGDGSYTVLGGSSTTQASGTKFHLDTGASASDRRELVMGNAWDGSTLTLASLSGYGNIRADWGSTSVIRTLRVEQDTHTTFSGTIGYSNGTRTIAFVKAGTGTLTMAGVMGYNMTVTASAGTLVLSAANTYTGTTTINGGTLLVTGALGATATTVSSGTLGGTGTITGAVAVTGGALSPGNGGIGTLTVSSTVTFSSGGAADMQINKSDTTLTCDKLQGVTTLTLGGTLNITASGDALTAGDSFTLFSATSRSGSFSAVNLPALSEGLVWNTSQLVTNGSISVKASNPLTSQTITFPAVPVKAIGDADFSPGATASSGLAVNYASSDTSVAVIVGGLIHIAGEGTTTITASQPGNSTYAAAADVSQVLTVIGTKTGQSIAFTALPVKVVGDADFAPGATAASGLTVSYTSSDTAVATIVNGQIHIVAAGTATITASQAGDVRYAAAADVAQTLTVNAVTSTGVWINASGGNWRLSTTSNWLNGTVANGSGMTADFGTLNITADATVTLTSSRTIGGLKFGDTTPSHNWIITSNTLTLTITSGLPVVAVNNQTATINSVMAGTQGMAKTGAGKLFLNNVLNTFTGNITVHAGTLQTGTAQGGGTYSYLGAINGTRVVTVGTGATLLLQGNNSLGGAGKTAASIPDTVVDGTLNATRYNILGDLILNGGTLLQSSTDSGGYEGWQFLGTVTVGGGAPATIQSGNGKANHLLGGSAIVFTVADATGNSDSDLVVANALRDGSSDYPGAGSLQKEGPGTMELVGANTYTGGTTVNAGTLMVTGSLMNSVVTVAVDASLGGTGVLLGTTTIHGKLQPGKNNIGTMTILNTITLDGTVEMQIDKSGSTRSADKVQGAGAVIFGGTLEVTATGDALAAGDSFTLFNKNSYSGAFARMNLPALADGLVWDVSNLAVDGSISVKAGQAITFNALPVKINGEEPFDPGAIASSGLGISYTSSDPTVAIVSESGRVTILGVGTANITASQTGNAMYLPAANVMQTLTVLASDADTDGDGMTNGKELQAGTDPQDPGSILTVRSIVPVEGGFRLTWSSVSGRSYVLQMADAVDGVYMPVTDVLAGDLSGLNAVTIQVDTGARQVYFRVIVY